MMSLAEAKKDRPWALRLLPPFPTVANRVMRLINSRDPDLQQIGDAIKLDPAFTAEILRTANSALFSAAREVTAVKMAVTRLGIDRVKAVAALIAMKGVLKPALKMEALRKSWTHSLVTAILAEECARAARRPVDTAYTAGLLHNLGSLGLMATYPEEYERMVAVASECAFDILRGELDLFEINHCHAGAQLAQEWGFPDEITQAIATHHDRPNMEDPSICGVVQVGWRMADALGFETVSVTEPLTYDELAALVPGTSGSWLGEGAEEVKKEVCARLSSLKL
jgi:putative nucleotidyltransferase with HDIG domain